MSVTATGGPRETAYKPETQERPESREYSRREPGENTPGGERPSDFGSPEANERGYEAELRHEERMAGIESKERMAHEKEEGKNYRAELQAHTAENASNNDNKAHKLFGKQSPQQAMPEKPSAS